VAALFDEHGRFKRPGSGDSRPGSVEGLPTEPGEWRAIARRHRTAILGVVCTAASLLALAALAWVVFVWPSTHGPTPARPAAPAHVPTSTIEPSEETTGASGDVSATVEATVTVEAGETLPAIPARAPFVAYRREGALWVVGEKGGTPIRVVASSAGVYALSPDASKIALVEATAERLVIVNVGTGVRKDAGPAAAVRPDWSPDSQWLVYTRPGARGEEVVRVAAGGYGATVLMRGTRGRFVRTADLVISAPPAGGPSLVAAVLSDGRTVRLGQKVTSVEVCPGPRGVYFVDTGGGSAPPSIRYVNYDGTGPLTIVSSPVGGANAGFSGLQVSPDGKWLVFAETGDDGYSRMFSRQSSGLKVIGLKAHRDSYFLQWGSDGLELFRIEGNALQGEATVLTALHPDGTAWRSVVEGAGF
jgi:hypothetical protein